MRMELPKHIGIIMDGNGRWAKKRHLPRNVGHKHGADVFGKIARYARDIGIKVLTFYAFSTENWKRPAQEVQFIMDLLEQYLRETEKYKDENIKLCFIGDRTPLNNTIKNLMEKAEENSKNNTGITVNLAINYGGRAEIVTAVKFLADQYKKGEIALSDINEQKISDTIYTRGNPDPDFILRPSGEHRSSNFLLWQSAYSEFIYIDVLWPDFTTKDFDTAIEIYSQRNRRFGGI